MQPEEQFTKISIDLLVPNSNQPRKYFSDESIKELAISIKNYGILNPILVRKKENLYEIIAGERRYRAAKLIGLQEVPVIIKTIDNTKSSAIALIENLQRENINPIEEAKSYQEILRNSNLKEQELSTLIGKSQPYISNKIRLLKLPQNIQEALINKKISERHARSLISVNNPDRQTELLNRIINEKLSVKELETIINEKEITDEEIKNAIDDIMKSLSINLDSEKNEKEEKESDNMNNGEFFPNQTNTGVPSSTMTLNNMNNQTLNQGPPMPTPSATPEATNQPFVYNQPTPEPAVAQPEVVAPIAPEVPNMPTLEVPNPMPDLVLPTAPTPEPAPAPVPEVTPAAPTLEIPNVLPNFGLPTAPTPEPAIAPVPEVAPSPIPEITATPMPDKPLFDPNSIVPPIPEPVIAPTPEPAPAPVPEVLTPPAIEVPVELAPTQPQDKLSEVEKYLNTNGINYKKYSNETGSCIIIES